jgi:hypothetical protein
MCHTSPRLKRVSDETERATVVLIHPGAIENMRAYRALLDRELGVAPSPELVGLVQ